MATNLENLEYSWIFSAQPEGKLTLHSGCSLCQAIHMQPSVSGGRKLLTWAVQNDRLLLVTWVVV